MPDVSICHNDFKSIDVIVIIHVSFIKMFYTLKLIIADLLYVRKGKNNVAK